MYMYMYRCYIGAVVYAEALNIPDSREWRLISKTIELDSGEICTYMYICIGAI